MVDRILVCLVVSLHHHVSVLERMKHGGSVVSSVFLETLACLCFSVNLVIELQLLALDSL